LNIDFLDQTKAFKQLKALLTSSKVTAYYQPEAETRLTVDGSPYGFGAILEQKQKNGEFGPVAYESRTLTDTERRYSQTEPEALSIVWAYERFQIYLYIVHFTVPTDHKTLTYIFKPQYKPPAIIEMDNEVTPIQFYSTLNTCKSKCSRCPLKTRKNAYR
jgi:hypothetical protein